MKQRKIYDAQRDFKGVWIPKQYWLDPNLTPLEMLFLVEIDSLDKSNGCYASNKHFADFFGVSRSWASRIIQSLKDKHYVDIYLQRDENGKQITGRTIKVVRIGNRGGSNPKEGWFGSGEESNTPKSNTPKRIYSRVSHDDHSFDIGQIIEYLNSKTGKHYRASTQKTKHLIQARFRDGYKLEDFIKVINNKVAEWSNDSTMAKYLQPSTLFAPSHFDEYLNSQTTNKKHEANYGDSQNQIDQLFNQNHKDYTAGFDNDSSQSKEHVNGPF